MKLKRIFLTMLAVSFLTVTASAKGIERKQLFDFDWQFALNDSTQWRSVDLPHDWSVEAAFDKDAPAGSEGGFLPTGKGWYRKNFVLGKEYRDKKLRLYFEGVYMNAEVYVNGHHAGGHPYGYSSFFVDITPYVKQGNNMVEVRVDNSQQKNCRWYTGSGIYRHVWLLTTNKIHLDEWGLFARSVFGHPVWGLTVDASYQDEAQTGATPYIRHVLYDSEGHAVSRCYSSEVRQTLAVTNPDLWSPDHPALYRLNTQLIVDGQVVDELDTPVGFRRIVYDAESGLLLNGKTVLLNGGCLHHDNGILGAAAYDRAEYRKVELMKKAGFNAVRTSHNPPSETFLKACDELGLLVVDEAFDGWREKKTDHDYASLIDQWWEHDLRAMVCRDRNHPSIFCWSTGNEVIERKKIEVVTTAHKMAKLCRQLDDRERPVTSALAAWDSDWEIYDPLADEHDIVGYNYMIHKSESDHERVPRRVMMQTESFPRDAWRNYRQVKDHSYVIGDFVWTAIDYLGESGIGRWYYEGDAPGEHWERPLFPWHGAYCGDIDLTGKRKPISYYRDMLYNSSSLKGKGGVYLAVREPDGYHGKVKETLWGTWPTFESWNWQGHEGKPVDVEVYSVYPKVRLYLNDRLVEEKEVEACKAVFSLPYEHGVLRAEGVADGQVTETASLQSAGQAHTIRLTADHLNMKADGQDLAFITVELQDAHGIVNPVADNSLRVQVKGAATLIAFGNADIKDTDSYADATHKAWKGRALLVVKSSRKAGSIEVTVSGDKLSTARLKLKAESRSSK